MEPDASRWERLEHEVAMLSKQLTGVRRANRGWRWACALLCIGLATGLGVLQRSGSLALDGLFTGDSSPKAVEGSGFVLLSRQGQKTVILDNDRFDVPTMAFIAKDKSYRADLKVGNDGWAGMRLFGPGGLRGRLMTSDRGESVLEMLGEGGKGGVMLKVLADGSPSLLMTDPSGKILFQAPTPTP